VSKLFRVVSLSRALKLSIPEFLSLRALVDVDPFDSDKIQNAVRFVDAVVKIRASGFSIGDLDYLLRHRFPPSSSIAPREETVALLLSQLRSELQKIQEETKFVADPAGDVTRSRLVLLKWSDAHIEQAIATLNDTVTYTAPLAALPAGVVLSQESYEVPLAQLPSGIILSDAVDGVSYDPSANQLKSTHALTVAERTVLLGRSSNSNYQHAIEALFDLGRISYNAQAQTLQFVGAMTQAGQAHLLTLANNAGYQSAVNQLFEAPRTFISTKMKAFEWPTWSAALQSLPKKIVFPDALKTRIFYDPTAHELRFVGLMTEDEATTLRDLVISSDPGSSDYQAAIDSLFNAPNSWQPQDKNQFMTSADAAQLFDAAKPPEERFQLVLARPLTYLRTSSSENLVKQMLAGALGLEARVAEALLTKWVYSPVGITKRPCITDFLEPAFAESHPDVELTAEAFEGPFESFGLLHKIALLLIKFSVTTEQLIWLFDYGPKVGWLDLNALPLKPADFGLKRFHGWKRLADLFDLRDRLPLGADVLADVLATARDKTATEKALQQRLSQQTGWSSDDIDYLVKAFGFKFPDAYLDERAMKRMIACFGLMKRLGVSAERCNAWSQPDLLPEDGRSAKQAVKAKYGDTQWLEVAPPLRNALREKQRAALVAYLVTNPLPDKSKPFWQDVNGLYAHFLIDVEMSPCMMTSRIKQAICSVQLFVQRALMSFEPEVNLNEDAAREWKWMNNGPFWEANRHVLVESENWIEPDWRDDKSPFFKELENELLQREVTKDTAEDAFLHYLEKLDQVAHLEVVGMYHEREYPKGAAGIPKYLDRPTIDVLHVFGRTKSDPHIYFYRRWVDNSDWTGWEKVDLDIEGDHLVPVVWNRRLYLFWPIFTEKSEGGEGEEKKRGPDKDHPNYLPPADSIYAADHSNFRWDGKSWVPPEGEVFSNVMFPETKADPAGPLADWEFKVIGTFTSYSGEELVYWWNWAEPGDEISEAPQPPKSYWELKIAWSEYKNGGWSAKRTSKAQRVEPFQPREEYTFKARAQKDDLLGEALTITVYSAFESGWTSVPKLNFLYDDCKGGISERVLTFIYSGAGSSSSAGAGSPAGVGSGFGSPVPHGALHRPQKSQFNYMTFEELYLAAAEADDSLYLLVKETSPDQVLVPDEMVLNKTPGTYRILYPHQDEQFVATRRPCFYQDDVKTFFITAGTIEETINDNPLGAIPGPPFGWHTAVKLQSTKLRFRPFYHPFVCEFIKRLKRDGIDGLLRRETQALPFVLGIGKGTGYRGYTEDQKNELQTIFEQQYGPSEAFVTKPYPIEDVDFSPDGAYSIYNWELFFHIPFLIADRLRTNYRFEEAQQKLRCIFDETANFTPFERQIEPLKDPSARYWKVLPFYNNPDAKTSILQKMELLQYHGTDAKILEKKTNLENLIAQWRDNSYQPYLIGRYLVTPFQKALAMKCCDINIAWGDQDFRQDTIESINQATQKFIVAAQILGRRPEKVPPRAVTAAKTYAELEPDLDKFSNAAVQIENLLSLKSAKASSNGNVPLLPFGTTLYFCIPKNKKLLDYWDTVADRLFKIRHCMNIEGVVRTLPLFEPPIEPGLLIKAAAAGIDLSSVLNDLHAPLPHYKFSVMMAKAHELCAEVKALGAALLSTLEKRDAEELALLHSRHELKLLDAVRQIKKDQIDEANQALAGLEQAEKMAMARHDYYSNIQFMNASESAQLDLMMVSAIIQAVGQELEIAAGLAEPLPDIFQGGAGTYGSPLLFSHTGGGSKIAGALQTAGRAAGMFASILNTGATMAGIFGGYQRRSDEWELQKTLAEKEWKQIAKQILAAKARKAIAEKDLENHDLQVENAKEADSFLRQKFTNLQLWDRNISQLSSLNFQTYKLLYDHCKRTEKAFQYELGVSDSFIQFGYWDSLKKGLLAGEKLSYDLRRMELAYLEQNRRDYEITKHISLRMLDPIALIQLKETASCFFSLPEELFDLDYPGHYNRRITSVSLTIPAVTGPYTNVSCTLTLLTNGVRIRPTVDADRDYPWTSGDFEDPRFTYNMGGVQSIVTSSAQNDSGTFEHNLHDERRLFFEGAGVISTWSLELPDEFRSLDYATIQDVVLTVLYKSRPGGDLLKQAALDHLRAITEQGSLYQMFSARQEFSSEWYKFLNPPAEKSHELVLDLQRSHFRYHSANKSLSLKSITLFMKLKLAENVAYHDGNPIMYDLVTVGPTGEVSEVTPPEAANKSFKNVVFRGRTIDGLIKAMPFTNQSPGKALGRRLMRILTPIPQGFHVKNNASRLDAEAIDDLLVVCEYVLSN
jgi:hypothetical protein